MEFGLLKSFDIDNGELDGLTPQEIFVLGYELAQIDSRLERADKISLMVHSDNRPRIEKSCKDSGRNFSLNWMEGDRSESWMQLEVAAI